MQLNSCANIYMSIAPGIICRCQNPGQYSKNKQFSGNYNNSSKTNAMRFSEIVRGTNNGRTQFVYNNLNAFGYYSGGPGGSGEPPRNSF
jgi:hypothetical protein